MNRQLNSPSGGATIVGVLKPYEGGLGTTTVETARAALNAVASTQVGTANGVAQLTNDGFINPDNVPADGVTLVAIQGPTSMGINSVATFEITNYDAFTEYVLTALSGSVKRYKNTITYESSGSAGPSGFRINGRLFAVNIVGDRPAIPVLTSALYGSSKSVVATLTSSAFAMNSGTGTHFATDWQIATDALFDNIVKSSMFNTTALTTISFDGLAVRTTYYARCRYRDNNGNYSPWSTTIVFATQDDYKIDTEEISLRSPAYPTGAGFDYMRMTKDGSRVIIRTQSETQLGLTGSGAAYLFVRTGVTWSLEWKFTPSDLAAGDRFGFAVAIDDDGNRVAIGSYQNDPDGVSNAGSIYVYKRTGVTWGAEQKITASDKYAGALFGRRIAMDSTGTRIVTGCTAVGSNTPSLYIYSRSGTTWSQEARIPRPAIDGTSALDQWMAMDAGGARLIVSIPTYPVSGSAVGAAQIFRRDGTSWSLETSIFAPVGVAGSEFGTMTDFNAAGDLAIVGSRFDNTSVTNSGAAYIYSRSGTTWTLVVKIAPPLPEDGGRFGAAVAVDDLGQRVVIGSSLASISGVKTGCAYVYAKNGAKWELESTLSAVGLTATDQYGFVLDISGDGSRACVAMQAASIDGAVYIYR
jgi:FG-GAP repeat